MKKSRLTLYIAVALVLGIATGYGYNLRVIAGLNGKIIQAGNHIGILNNWMRAPGDSSSAEFRHLQNSLNGEEHEKQQAENQREVKLEGFTVLSDIFLRLIRMIVAPLVFTTLIGGIARVGDVTSVGRIAGKTMIWFVSASFLSLFLGMIAVNLLQPGAALHVALPASATDVSLKTGALSLREFATHVVPRSIVEAMANNEILQVVVFALFFGTATAAIGPKGELIIAFMDAASHVVMKMTTYVMKLAPIAVFAAMTVVVAKQGLGIITAYASFICEFYGALLLLCLLMAAAGYFVVGKRLFTLIRRVEDAVIVAFSTSTSEAAYPRSLEELERFGCSNRIVSFVLPLGYSFNLVGSMMYMTFASLFLAQAFGVHLLLAEQLSMLLLLMLMSKGIAGVPRAALVVVAGAIGMFHIPEAGLALLLGIDPLLDMGRSATNVLGNVIATAVVSKWENQLIN